MKKLLALSLLLGSLTFGANAQSKSETINAQAPASRNHSAVKARDKDKGDRMKKELGLTADQQKQLKESNANFKTQKETIKNDASLSETAKSDKLKALHADKKAKMATILTPDQQNKLKEMKEKRKARKSKK